jgi:sterol 24-C-methyltransferase
MGASKLEMENHSRDAEFAKALHGKSPEERAGIMAMLKKNPEAQKAAIDSYFKHWDNKAAGEETAETRAVSGDRA